MGAMETTVLGVGDGVPGGVLTAVEAAVVWKPPRGVGSGGLVGKGAAASAVAVATGVSVFKTTTTKVAGAPGVIVRLVSDRGLLFRKPDIAT